jgi:hypothetical protein
MQTQQINYMNPKMPAGNGRFCKSGAVTRPKGSGNFQVLCLVSSAVEAPPSQSRWALHASEVTVRFRQRIRSKMMCNLTENYNFAE